ncbi:MAG: hypothetical protein JKY56_24010 [Kofleriaceae bacterium]|nr:hypothetical protein [Kofleriaceae bacterium]
MRFSAALIAFIVASGCIAPKNTPIVNSVGESTKGTESAKGNEVKLPMMSPEQRSRIEQRLSEYGPGWNLEHIEKQFTIDVDETPSGFTLTFTARGKSGLWSTRWLGNKTDFRGGALATPEGAELSPEQRRSVSEVLKAKATLWMIESTNGFVQKLDLTQGIEGLQGAGTLETRWRGGLALLYFFNSQHQASSAPFVLAVDLNANSIVEGGWHDLPPRESHLLQPDEFSFLDNALRTNGDFGVYGAVTEGIAELAANSNLTIVRSAESYSVSISPRDGHGHELSFSIDRKTGEISNMAAGHSIPPPMLDEIPDPEPTE